MVMTEKIIIGQAEYVWLTEQGIKRVPARIDTGARTSSLWASNIQETPNGLTYSLFGASSPLYTGETVTAKHFSQIVVASSNGHVQKRYKVPMTMQLKGRRIKTYCTLSDRESLAYPMLIGRNTLRGKFIVDVQKSSRSLVAFDDKRYDELQSLLSITD